MRFLAIATIILFTTYVSAQNSAQTWSDPANGLMWPLHDNGTQVDWQAAVDYCRALNLGGYSDWRLPTTDELLSAYDLNAIPVHLKPPLHSSSNFVWSATANPANKTADLFVNGTVAAGMAIPKTPTPGNALCVRGTATGPLLPIDGAKKIATKSWTIRTRVPLPARSTITER